MNKLLLVLFILSSTAFAETARNNEAQDTMLSIQRDNLDRYYGN